MVLPSPRLRPMDQMDDPPPLYNTLHLFKNQLQQYAQKQNLNLPVYSSEFYGPPHARRFKSRVTINGQTFVTTEEFSSLKDAEHAAAKVAFDSLTDGGNPEDESLYKTLLQELSQKVNLCLPRYATVRSGPSHCPIFESTVEVGGITYRGREAKTKKNAEVAAARAAYNDLIARKTIQSHSRCYLIEGTPHMLNPDKQSVANSDQQLIMKSNARERQFEEVVSEGSEAKDDFRAIRTSLSNLEPVNVDELQTAVQPESEGSEAKDDFTAIRTSLSNLESFNVDELQTAVQPESEGSEAKDDFTAIRTSLSSSEPVNVDDLQGAVQPKSEGRTPEELVTEAKDHLKNSPVVDSDLGDFSSGSPKLTKIIVCSRKSAYKKIPDGAAVLHCDDGWVAASLESKGKTKTN